MRNFITSFVRDHSNEIAIEFAVQIFSETLLNGGKFFDDKHAIPIKYSQRHRVLELKYLSCNHWQIQSGKCYSKMPL